MTATEWRVTVGDATTSAAYEPATSGGAGALFICAHGAGGSMSDRATLAAANELRRRGLGVVRFNFLYKERGFGRAGSDAEVDADLRGSRRTRSA